MADKLEERLRGLLAEADVLPLAYRPWQYDDWGTIRGGGTDEREESLHFIASVRDSRVNQDTYPQHRAAKTDPYEAVTKLFVEGLNALPGLLDEITRLNALVDEMREGLEPFAKAEITGTLSCPSSTPLSDHDVYEVEGLKVADFSRALALITKASRDSGHG